MGFVCVDIGRWTLDLLVDYYFSPVFCYIKTRCIVVAANNQFEHFFFFFILHSFIYWKLSTWLLHFESHITFAWHLIHYISIYHYYIRCPLSFSLSVMDHKPFFMDRYFSSKITINWIAIQELFERNELWHVIHFKLKWSNWKQLQVSFSHLLRISNI